MLFSQILAWRIYVFFKPQVRLLNRIGLAFIIGMLLTGVATFLFFLSHETVLAQSNKVPISDDVSPTFSQNIQGLVESTHPKAKKHTHSSYSEAVIINPTSKRLSNPRTRLPILMYHKPPVNFESQLGTVSAKGYTPIHMDEAAKIIRGYESGPPKPVVITFDDGFSDQLGAIELLKKHNMKATFYIIIGGGLSHGCLGTERTKLDCGDSYMNWNEIKALANSDLIEFGSHTFDHVDLPTVSETEQINQIENSKKYIENALGKPIYSFAYPYGHYSPTIAKLAQKAGYSSAVTTIGGFEQSANELFELHRIRDTNLLP